MFFTLVNRNKIFDWWVLSIAGVTFKRVPDFASRRKKYLPLHEYRMRPFI